jgi:hypothetical protein
MQDKKKSAMFWAMLILYSGALWLVFDIYLHNADYLKAGTYASWICRAVFLTSLVGYITTNTPQDGR